MMSTVQSDIFKTNSASSSIKALLKHVIMFRNRIKMKVQQ